MTENGTQMYMPVAPAYSAGGNFGGGFGYGGDWWLILILLFAFGGWGNGGFGGYGGGQLGYDFPWLLNGQQGINANTNAGFNQAATASAISGLQNSVTSGFGDVQLGIANTNQAICQTGASINANLSNGFAQAEIANNGRQIANLQQSFANQTAITGAINNLSAQQANCCCENRLAVANLGSDIAREACADRQAVNEGVRDILANQTAGIQRILDKLCDQELMAERRTNDQLRQQLNMANLQASQVAQTAELRQSGATQLNQLVSELRSCPIPAQPVYGSQPIFTCPNSYSGCGCGA